MKSLKGDQAAASKEELAGKAALIASVGGQRGYADWTNPAASDPTWPSATCPPGGSTFLAP